MKGLITTLIIAGFLVGCAPANNQYFNAPAAEAGTNGYKNPNGRSYTIGGDTRVPGALAEQRQEEAANPNVPQPPPGEKRLRERMIAFSLIRRDAGSNQAKRFGKNNFLLSIFIRNSAGGSYTEAKFAGKFGGTMDRLEVGPIVSSNEPNYTLTGELNDRDNKVSGEFTLTNTKTKEKGRVLYRAFKATINVRLDQSPEAKEANAKFADSIAKLNTDTFAWVNNWTGLDGPSFYSADIVRVIYNDTVPNMPILSFNGAAVATVSQSDIEHVAKVVQNNSNIESVTMIGDAAEEGNRLLEVKLKDKASGAETNFLVEMEEESPEAKAIEALPDYTGDVAVAEQTPPRLAQGSDTPTPTTKPVRDDVPIGLRGVTENSFFKFDLSDPLASKMVADYDSNWDFDQIQQWILTFKSQKGWRAQLTNFFYYSKPFVSLIEAIGSVYKSPPSFSYLTVMESSYFKGKGYKGKKLLHNEYYVNKPNSVNAAGIFQIKPAAAKDSGLSVTKGSDERMYFSTSACGAAQYVRSMTKDKKDATLGILAYTRGPGNFADEFALTKRLVKSYDLTYKMMAKFNASMDAEHKDYVNKFLAIYFISGDPVKYGFSTEGLSGLPAGSVIPPAPIHSEMCREAVAMSGIL